MLHGNIDVVDIPCSFLGNSNLSFSSVLHINFGHVDMFLCIAQRLAPFLIGRNFSSTLFHLAIP